ncbi:14653_t:CDS:2, partial [Funneliformis mosseae]
VKDDEIKRLKRQIQEFKEKAYESQKDNDRLKSQVLYLDKKVRNSVEEIEEIKSNQDEVEQLKDKIEELKKENTKLLRSQGLQ